MTPNLRAPYYFILSSQCACAACGQDTAVHALAVPPSHETLAPDDGADEPPEPSTDGPRDDGWRRDPSAAVLSGVSLLAQEVGEILARQAPGFAPDPKRKDVWTNHCGHCAVPILYGQLMALPGRAFTPTDAEQARAIGVQRIEAPLEAYVELRWTDGDPDLRPLLQRLGVAAAPLP